MAKTVMNNPKWSILSKTIGTTRERLSMTKMAKNVLQKAKLAKGKGEG